MSTHISKLCSSASYHLRNISQIQWFLKVKATEQLVHTLISWTRAMLSCMVCQVQHFTRSSMFAEIQNHAAGLVVGVGVGLGVGVREHMAPVLKTLHWLPICQWIKFRVFVQMYRALHWQGPSYTVDMLQLYRPSRLLWLASNELLVVPRCKKVFDDRAFSTFAPTLWNSLPTSVWPADSVDF